MKKNFYIISITSITCLIASIGLLISSCGIAMENKVSEQNVANLTETVSSTETNDVDNSTVLNTEYVEEFTTYSQTTAQETTTISEKTTTVQKETTTKNTTTTRKATTVPSTTSITLKAPNYTPEREVIEIFEAINDYREENGLNRLVLDKELCKLAYVRAQEQGQVEGHTRPDGSSAATITSEYGYERNGFGENIMIGPDADCYETVQGWKNSSGHNENMLRSKWKKSGIALCILDNGEYAIVHLFAY